MTARPTARAAKRRRLRHALARSQPAVAVGVHDALSARLADGSGFDAVWMSGLGVSAMAYALPDANLLTMTEALDAARRIDAATGLPVIADCDNGYGTGANVVRTVREFARAGIAGVCIEDNDFPKVNSLRRDGDRRLVGVEEQARRLRAARAADDGEDLVLIARTEALIAGRGVTEALTRARAYEQAGADAILVHSRDETLVELKSFVDRWRGSRPLVAVPTLYPTASVDELGELGFGLVIFANHLMRAAIAAMESTLETLRRERRPIAAEDAIVSVQHVIDLVEGTSAELRRG